MRKSRWIGIDLSSGVFCAAYSDGTEIAEAVFKTSRKCGCFVAAALPASNLFVETVELPSSAKGNISTYLPGLMDVKLPFPVEDCLLANGVKNGSSALAFAITRVEYLRQLNQFVSIAGAQPERVAPAPLVLWNKAFANARRLFPSGDGVLFHLHASTQSWTLIAGKFSDGSVQNVLTVGAGDIAAVSRNIRILLSRMAIDSSFISISGDAATDELVGSLNSLGFNAAAVAEPKTFLAQALAEDAEGGKSPDGNFAKGEFEHVASVNRRLHRVIASSLFLLLLALGFLFCAVNFKMKTGASLQRVDKELGQIANRFAGRLTGLAGPASIRLALNEFDSRQVKAVSLYGEPGPLDALGDIFTFMNVREMTLSSLNLSEGVMTFVCRTSNEGNIDSLKGLLVDSGYSVECRQHDGDGKDYLFSVSQMGGR